VKGISWTLRTLYSARVLLLNLILNNITFAYIPLHPSSRSSQLLHDWLFRDEPFGDYLYVGAFYVESDFPGCPGFDPLKAGIYHLKLRSDLKVVAVDSEGNEFVIGHAEKRQQQSLNATFESPATIDFWRVLIVLCASGDVQICVKSKSCKTVRNPDGSEATVCEEFEFCVAC